jgi:cell division protease FtsH
MTAWEGDEQRMGNSGISEEKEQAIDAEVSKLTTEAYDATMKLLTEHRAVMDELVKRLLEKETVDGFEFNDIVLQVTGKPPLTPFNPVPTSGTVVPVRSEKSESVTS